MELSARLKAIADYVIEGDCIADIGTDHGLIPIYLVKTNKVKRAFAMDIGKGPLLRAKQHIATENLNMYIETRLSNGLEHLPEAGVDTIIIAGMGGMLISEILLAYPHKLKTIKRLILSPHLDIRAVRETLINLSFEIVEESIVYDNQKYYPIVVANHSEKMINYTDIEKSYGKVALYNKKVLATYLNYLIKQEDKLNKLYQQVAHFEERGKIIHQELIMIREVISNVRNC